MARAACLRLAGALMLALSGAGAQADVAMIQPPRQVSGAAPFTLTLLYGGDETPRGYDVPPTLEVVLTSSDNVPRRMTLARDTHSPTRLRLKPGEYRQVRYQAAWPSDLRGMVRVAPVGIDASPALVTLNRTDVAPSNPANGSTTGTAQGPVPAPATSVAAQPAAPAQAPQALGQSRLAFFEPFYMAVGKNGDASARFQLSFRYRLVEPSDPASKALLDNLYFGYTQTSIWDLSQTSKPFRDTSYRPSLFYDLADTGWHSPYWSRLGIRAGVGHESNGQAGATSRSLNIAFVRPTVTWGDPEGRFVSFSPKLYYYLEKSENADIARYRGYADLLFTVGDRNGLELATTVRKGTHALYGSVDMQLTYPMNKFFGGALGGYLWLGYFNGYGEDLLDYNHRQHWIARIGYSIAR